MNYRHIVFVLPLTFQVSNTKLAQLRSYEMGNLIISQYVDTPHMWAKVPSNWRPNIWNAQMQAKMQNKLQIEDIV